MNLKKILLGLVAAAVVVAVAVPVALGANNSNNGAAVTKTCIHTLPGFTGCQFGFIDGNGNPITYNPANYNDVITSSGNENEHFDGTGIPNNTGGDVTYNATNMPGQTCYSFATTNTTSDWQMVIHADGSYALDCHFSK
jgi:hypothetical protein